MKDDKCYFSLILTDVNPSSSCAVQQMKHIKVLMSDSVSSNSVTRCKWICLKSLLY